MSTESSTCRSWMPSGMLELPLDNSASSIEHKVFLEKDMAGVVEKSSYLAD